MQKQVLIACSMMENEIKAAMDELGSDIPVIWMRRALHNSPPDMRNTLKAQIDELPDYDDILLAYGLCGNGTGGLFCKTSRLVIPRFDDCINILLCTGERKERVLSETGCLYLTEGWIQDELSIVQQCEKLRSKYNEEMYHTIVNSIYGGYHSICVIDTGCYDLSPVLKYAEKAAALIDASVRVVGGSNIILRRLISGDWDRDFVVLEPGEKMDHKRLLGPYDR